VREEKSASEVCGFTVGTGALSEADLDCSDDDFGAAPILQSPSKEIYEHHHSQHMQQNDSGHYDQDADSGAIPQPPIQHELEHLTIFTAEREQAQQQQLYPVDQEELVARASVTREDHQLEFPPPQFVSAVPLCSEGLSNQLDEPSVEKDAAAKFVFIASFGLTLCEDGRGYWYISAKVGENRLPALSIGDVIRTVADATARGWGADTMCAALDKGGVEIGIQRGLTAAMRFVTLPVADAFGSQIPDEPVSRHGLGFAFKRNEDSGALVVTNVRDGSAAALCRCLEVGDILLEVRVEQFSGFPNSKLMREPFRSMVCTWSDSLPA
jgi:hypothetical protein